MTKTIIQNDFLELSYNDKLKKLQKLLKDYELEVIITELIKINFDITECFNLLKDLRKPNNLNKKYKIKNIELISLILNILFKQNKNKELYAYLSKFDRIELEKIFNYEKKQQTIFSKSKMFKIFQKKLGIFKINKNKKNVLADIQESKKSKLIKNTKKVLKTEIKNKKVKFGIGTIILITILVINLFLLSALYSIIVYYNNHVYPNTYLNGNLITGKTYKEVYSILDDIDKNLNVEVKLINVNGSYIYTYHDMGVKVNIENLKNQLNSYKNLNGFQKIYQIFFKNKDELDITYEIENERYQTFVSNLKSQTDTFVKDESFQIINDSISYEKGVDGFTLDTNNLQELIFKSLKNNKREIYLEGNVVKVNNKLNVINKKVATFTTYYNESQRRSINIKTAVSRINGKILYPNEIFSFSNLTRLYSTKGYVFYDKYIGSGVCQVSTNVYNVALLLNLPIIERSNHGEMVYYVDYGMDATVYSTTTDLKFKNSSQYPIYIEAKANNGTLIVSFWSNENIVEKGYSYKPRSVKIGTLAYKTYLDTYYNGVYQSTKYLNSSYYYKGK